MRSLAAYGNVLFALTDSGRLVRTTDDSVFENTGWRVLNRTGEALNLRTLAIIDGMAYATSTRLRALYRLDLHGVR
jgi:hypothetical protein